MLKDFIEATKRGKCDVIDNRFVKRDTSGNSHNPNPNCSPSSSSSPSSSPDSNSDRIFTAEHGAAWTTSHDRWSTTKQDQKVPTIYKHQQSIRLCPNAEITLQRVWLYRNYSRRGSKN